MINLDNINKIIIDIALQRCSNPDKLEDFLYPEKIDLLDPFDLRGVKEASEKIISSVKKNEKILIYGDYDADGITSTALLFKALSKIHDKIFYYIPQRDGEGYGLNREALTVIFNQGINLLITVDCGIKSFDLVEEFTQKGIEFIITDHHTPDEILPQAIIVNPKFSGEKEFYDLAGVGLAYVLASALGKQYKEIQEIDSELIQLAALGTVADLVNLSMENRKIVRKGLIQLNMKAIIGIQSLINKNNIVEINSKTISFLLAPIINSSGRMESPEIALKLLIEDKISATDILADELIQLNNKRKDLVNKVYKEVQKKILEKQYFSDPIIVVNNSDWPHGVLGIVASKLLNEYKRPVILLSESDNGIYKGSGRSIENYNIFNALKKQENIIEEFGGHAQAAGLSISKDNIAILRNKLIGDIYQQLEHEDFYDEYTSDANLSGIEEITDDLYTDLALLEPFGTGNPEPLFCFENPVDLKLKKIGKLKDHLRINISGNKKKINGVYFNYQEYPGEETKKNIIFSIGINEWQNKVSLQLEVKKIINGERTESQKMEQSIYSSLYFSDEKSIKSFTIEGRIKYNEVWDILSKSRNIIYSNDQKQILNQYEKISKEDLLLYNNDREFPENFKNLKRYLKLGTEGTLLTNSFLIKKEILINTDNYIFFGEEPKDKILSFLKNINPAINIFIMEESFKRNNISREELSTFYIILKKLYSSTACYYLSEIPSFIKKNNNKEMSPEDIVLAVMIFEELGFLDYSLKNNILEVNLSVNPKNNKLENSRLYNMTNYK